MRLLLAASIVASLTFFASPAEAAAPSNCRTTPVVAHRSIITNQLENTKKGMRAAVAADAPFEVDVRTTADNEMVLLHDAKIARTTNGTGRVGYLTADRIRSYELDDGHVVPYAATALRLVRDHPGAKVYLDLKTLSRASHNELAEKIADYGITKQVVVISFHPELLAGVRSRSPRVPTFHIEKRNLPTVDQAAEYGGVNVYVDEMTPSWIRRMHARGIPFSMRIDDRRAAWDEALAADVESIMTDDVYAFRRYCNA